MDLAGHTCYYNNVALRGGIISMPTKSDALKVIHSRDSDELKGWADKALVVPDRSVQKNTDAQIRRSGFRPLTENEKNEFVNSLDAEGRKILEEFLGKESSPDPAGA